MLRKLNKKADGNPEGVSVSWLIALGLLVIVVKKSVVNSLKLVEHIVTCDINFNALITNYFCLVDLLKKMALQMSY